MKILFLSRWFPFPLNNGSKLRVAGLLRALSEQHDVTLLSFADQPDVNPDAPELRSLCSEVHMIPWREFNPHSSRARSGFFGSKPRFLSDTYSTEMDTLIRTLISKHKYDLVIASQLSMASYYPCFAGTPALFEEVELGLFHDQAASTKGFLKRLRLNLTWLKLRWYLSKLLDSFQACTVASEREQGIFLKSFPQHRAKIKVIPNCISFDDYQELGVKPTPNQLIFSGSFRFPANYEAMQWFVGEVYPKILQQIPETSLVITGDHANQSLPAAPNITMAGYVDDIKSSIGSAAISIAPLLSGGGTRLKIIEAMALGIPVVSTSKGTEGLGSVSGEHLLVADSADAFADQVVKVLKNRSLWSELSLNGRKFVKENYNWDAVKPRFLHLVESAIG